MAILSVVFLASRGSTPRIPTNALGASRVIAFPVKAASGIARLAGHVRAIAGDEEAQAFAAATRDAGSGAELASKALADKVEAWMQKGLDSEAQLLLRMTSALVA